MTRAEDGRAGWRRIVRAREREGREDYERCEDEPSLLSQLPLGGASPQSRASLACQAVALALHVPPAVLSAVGTIVPGRRASAAWFGFAATYAYWSGVRKAAGPDVWRRLRRGVLILMYHAVGGAGERPSRYVVPVKRFERQMKWLKRRRYNVISLDEYVRYRSEFRVPPGKTVVVTFDDGYVDNFALAEPILERLGLPATVFLVSSAEGRNTWSTGDGLANRPLIALEDARRALGGAFTFGAHTRTHPKLPELSAEEAEREIAGSKEELEAALGVPLTTFAYPYGRVNPAVRELVGDAGFSGACGVVGGRNRAAGDDLELRRVEVLGTRGLLRFAITVWLGDVGKPRRRRA
jgi:peptidoglycan/xylan/chitin deacetylase (PgdA/CDA1 family)